MSIDKMALKALAEAATPGPWHAENDRHEGSINADYRHIGMVSMHAKVREDISQNFANQEFIAAANPAAVLELIAETELLRIQLAEQDALLSVLEQCAAALWDDSREIRMDSTMMFGPSYDWDGWENYREELHTRAGSFAIWPAHGTYSAYGGEDGTYWNQSFATSAEAKSAVVKHLVKLDPDHPAVKACLVIAKVREHIVAPSFSADTSAPVRSVVMPESEVARLLEEYKSHLAKANGLLRSCHAVAERVAVEYGTQVAGTNFGALHAQLNQLLTEQHEIMYGEPTKLNELKS